MTPSAVTRERRRWRVRRASRRVGRGASSSSSNGSPKGLDDGEGMRPSVGKLAPMSRAQSDDALDPADLPAEERDDDAIAADLAEAPDTDLEVVPGEADAELEELDGDEDAAADLDEDDEPEFDDVDDEDELDDDLGDEVDEDEHLDDEPDDDELDDDAEEALVVGAATTKAQRDAKRAKERASLRGGRSGKGASAKGSGKGASSGKGATTAKAAATPAGTKKHRSSSESAVAAAAAAAAKRQRVARDPDANPAWFKPLMFGFLIVGFLWIIVYYLSNGRLPIQELGAWNILVGFGIAFVGFLMTTNWK